MLKALSRWVFASVLGVSLLGVMVPVTMTGCFGHQCDGSYLRLDDGAGRLVSADTWESNGIEDRWLDYAPQRTIAIPLKQLGNRWPTSVLVYVSGHPRPVGEEPQHSFALATGNLSTLQWVSKNSIDVRNDTCAQYYTRVVISVAPQSALPHAAITSDADDVVVNIDASDAK